MEEELSNAELQDLSAALDLYRHKDVNQMIERFQLEELAATADVTGSTSDKIYALLKNMETNRQLAIIQFLIDENSPLRKDTLESVENTLRNTPWEIAVTEENGTVIRQENNRNNPPKGAGVDETDSDNQGYRGGSPRDSQPASTWDIFLCHAGEDKEPIVRPLANELREMDIQVWYDEFELEIGDDLRESIDKGLRKTDYGLVVLSEHFFGKHWTKRELRGLLAREETENAVILPLWYDIDKEEVMEHSPPLANKVAEQVNEDNISDVAQTIRQRIE